MNSGTREERRERLVATCARRLVVGCVLLGLAACGAPVSEKAPEQAPSAGKAETSGAGVVAGAVQRGADQHNRKTVSASQPVADTDEQDNRSIPGIPEKVLTDLGAADPRTRYRALEHWEVKDNNVSLDPVFEAMEDEDEAVRAKAAEIVEQRWAEKQEKKRS